MPAKAPKKKERTRQKISEIMRRVHSRDTTPEVYFRKALWASGLRYRTCSSKLAGKPDIVLPSKRLAIFIDGDYWHGNQWKRRNLPSLEDQFHSTESKEYWLKKIRGNMNRDCAATATLLREGWQVLRFWESDIKKDIEGCVALALDAARNNIKSDPFSILPQKTFAEFFTGIGLMRMAFENQGWTIAYGNDIDEQKYAIYREQFEDADNHYHLGDIHGIPAKDVPSVSLATASFPCNDLSLAGGRKGLKGKQSSAFWGFIRILEEMDSRRPPLVLLENVTGFLTSAKGKDFKDALLALNRLGYAVDAFILDAVHFVPQSRKRLFVMGMMELDRRSQPEKEASLASESGVRPKRLMDFISKHPRVHWRIRQLPEPPERTTTLGDILEDLPDSAPEWWEPERAEYLLNQMSPRHRATADEMIAGADWSYGTVFRRMRQGKSTAELRTDGTAGCLRTPRGGSARQILFKAGRNRYFARFLTPRECARLMGADDFRIVAPTNKALFGFGDAVCLPVIEWIAKYYLNPLVNELIRHRVLGPIK